MSLGPVRLQPEGRGLGLELWREAAAARDGGTGRKARAFSSSRLISQAEGSTGKPTEVYRGLNLVLSVKGREEPGPCGGGRGMPHLLKNLTFSLRALTSPELYPPCLFKHSSVSQRTAAHRRFCGRVGVGPLSCHIPSPISIPITMTVSRLRGPQDVISGQV